MTNELEQLKRLVEARAKQEALLDSTDGADIDQLELIGNVCDEFERLAGSTDLQAILSAWERDREEISMLRREVSRENQLVWKIIGLLESHQAMLQESREADRKHRDSLDPERTV